MNSDYSAGFVKFKKMLIDSVSNPERLEFVYERLNDWSLFGDVNVVLDWYSAQRKKCEMRVIPIPLSECVGWSMNNEGRICHVSGEFFSVDGIRVLNTGTREVKGGWDQPILTQVGHDGGILGTLRKRFSGIPHYLVEAKAEPGNYNFVQISPTVQATFSNLKRAHKGNGTPYAEYFLNPENYPVDIIFRQWTSEDGGRLFNKRNMTMLLELPESFDLEIIDERFRWISLYQLTQLIREQDAIVAPHIRGLLSGL